MTPIDDDYDRPSSIADHLKWLAAAGFAARVTWAEHDLAVFTAEPVTPRS